MLGQSLRAVELAEAAPLQLAELMGLLAKQERGSVRFRETRHYVRLKEPIVVIGALSFQKPDRLTKIVTQPKWERVDIVGAEASLRASESEPARTIRLDDVPVLNALIVALRATLVGDDAQLVRMFAIHLTGTKDDWRLVLVPRTAVIQEKVAQITIAGRGGVPTQFALVQSNGDRVVIEIEP